MAQMKDPASQERLKNNPNGTLSIWAAQTNMGRNLGLTFLTYLVISLLTAYVGWHALAGEQVGFMDVFRICTTAAFLGQGTGILTHMIWYQDKGFWTYLFDNLVYAGITGAIFAWLWLK
jgi:hypothetical protein